MKNLPAGLLVAFLFTFISATCFCQTLADLDSKKGFKDFHLGDPKSKWATQIKVDKQDNIRGLYNYSGSCCSSAFARKVSRIRLLFDSQDKLAAIIVEFEQLMGAPQIEDLGNDVKEAFGRRTSYEIRTDGFDFKEEWKGEIVALSIAGSYSISGLYNVALLYSFASADKAPQKDY